MADWEQLDSESNAAYTRFLIYRNLGVTRSLDAAYFSVTPQARNRKKSYGHASGQWTKESADFAWLTRAQAWDIEILTQVGQGVVTKYISALDKFAARIVETLEDSKLRPHSWESLVNAIVTLGDFIPPETVEAVQTTATNRRMPVLGKRPGESEQPERI